MLMSPADTPVVTFHWRIGQAEMAKAASLTRLAVGAVLAGTPQPRCSCLPPALRSPLHLNLFLVKQTLEGGFREH